MTLTLRKKLIIGFIGLDIIVSLLLGFFMYQIADTIFLQNYVMHKSSIAKFISNAMDGDIHKKILLNKDFKDPLFVAYQSLVNKTYKNEKSIRYLYTLVYFSEEDKFYYSTCANEKIKYNKCLEYGNIYTGDNVFLTKYRNIILSHSEVEIQIDTQDEIEKLTVVYSPIKNNNGDKIGIVVIGVSTDEINDFRNQMTSIALVLSFVTFCITTIIAFFLARHFTHPLEILSSAVNNLASGNLIMIEDFDKKDEFGNLAKSFNIMVNNLKIASEVQYNLIVEISNLNEGLERKVEERMHTIQEQSRELEKQIMIAQKIQLSLLPEDVPNINGANLSFRYQPMMRVGGDFIDFDYKNGNDLLLFICDVSGHGVPAAFLATMVKMALQDCYEMKLSPSQSLKRIHYSLQGKLSGHFLSAIYCHINLQDRIMTSANAGHLPLLKVGIDGTYEFINSKGRIICEAFNINTEESVTKLNIGDKIILYTDGVTEARNQNMEMFGEEKLIEISLQNHFETSSNLCNKIYDSVLAFTGNSQSMFTDDITILVAEFAGNEILV